MMKFAIGAAMTLAAYTSAIPAKANELTVLHATLGDKESPGTEISTAQMREIMRTGNAIILDTRSRPEFDAGHIPGAVPVQGKPAEQIAHVLKLVRNNKAQPLALYCNGPYCRASRAFAQILISDGFKDVRRYQLGIPVWRALGGPTAIEVSGVKRIAQGDRTAVYVDARPAEEFAKGSLPGAISAPVDDVLSGKQKKIALPEDDFNRRIILFGTNSDQALKLAGFMSGRPWHNVSYFNGTLEDMRSVMAGK